jgi:hypothetical protein
MIKKYFLLVVLLSMQTFGQVNVNIQTPLPMCQIGDCTFLFANIPILYQTNSYTVSIPNTPAFPFQWDGIDTHKINASGDDIWSPILNLPFNFCFYGTSYNQVLIGSNGVVTFDLNLAIDNCPWSFSTTIPNTTFPIKNAIYGVYQDTDIRDIASGGTITNSAIQNVNFYTLDTGLYAAPNRVYIINFNELPVYQCGNALGMQTSQIVLHEATNEIEVFVKKRSTCVSWNSGRGIIGIQNQSGTSAYTPMNRNTGSWITTNEAWRFSPNGAPSPYSIQWYKNDILIPEQITNSIVACPFQDQETYTVNVVYPNCNGNIILSDSVDLYIQQLPISNPFDLSICSNNTVETFNIDQSATILGALNPIDYEVTYHTSLLDANNGINPIVNTNSYTTSSGQVIYVRVFDVNTGCSTTRSFNLIINPIPSPPTGAALQTFTQGETLANLEVNGTNITWYSEAIDGVVLPNTTLLVNGTTYYATQTNAFSCESNRNVNANRLAVTVSNSLSNGDWDKNHFKASPIPVKNSLNLSYDAIISSVKVYTVLGQEVISKSIEAKQTRLDMSSLEKGTYFVKIVAGLQEKTIKVIKE